MLQPSGNACRLIGVLACIIQLQTAEAVGHGKVNCAYSPPLNRDYTYLPETPSGGDAQHGVGYVVGDRSETGTDGQCVITIEDTTISNQQTGNEHRIPSSTCSAFAMTSIGNYVLYGTGAPYRGIAAYALECRSAHPISEDMLFLPVEFFVKQIVVSHTGTDFQHSSSLMVTLNFDALPAAFEILTFGDRFRISPCITVFPHEHASDVAMLDRNKVTIVVFSVHNVNPNPPPKDRYAPVYLSAYHHRNATLCGYVPVAHTRKVELWLQEGVIMATFVQHRPNSQRSFIRFFTIKITGKTCKAEPWSRQTVMGALPWETGFSVLPPGNPSQLVPFTVDNILCGVEDVRVIQTSSFTALVVAISNADTCLENSCSHEDMLVFEQSNSQSTVRVCGCAYAIKTSFAIFLSTATKNFALDLSKPSTFQLLKAGPDLTTEIQVMMLPCCALLQLCSTTGICDLYTLRVDSRTSEFDATRVSGTRLPSLIESSAVGTCRKNTVAVSYSGVEPSSKPMIFKFSCTNYHDPQAGNGDDAPRFHLALQLQNGSGAHIPVSESLPGNRRHSATPYYVRPPVSNTGTGWMGDPRAPDFGDRSQTGLPGRFFADAPIASMGPAQPTQFPELRRGLQANYGAAYPGFGTGPRFQAGLHAGDSEGDRRRYPDFGGNRFGQQTG